MTKREFNFARNKCTRCKRRRADRTTISAGTYASGRSVAIRRIVVRISRPSDFEVLKMPILPSFIFVVFFFAIVSDDDTFTNEQTSTPSTFAEQFASLFLKSNKVTFVETTKTRMSGWHSANYSRIVVVRVFQINLRGSSVLYSFCFPIVLLVFYIFEAQIHFLVLKVRFLLFPLFRKFSHLQQCEKFCLDP